MSFTSLSVLLPFIRVLLLSPILASADVSPYYNSQEFQDGAYGNYTVQKYISEPGIRAPVGDILVAPKAGVVSPSEYVVWTPVGSGRGQNGHGPMILNSTDLSLVYAAPEFYERGMHFTGRESIGATVQTCNNTDYLTWWGGKGYNGYKAGRYYMLDTNYNLAYNVSAVDHEFGDAHEFFLTPECTAVFTSYYHRQFDLSHYNISDGWIIENSFQEVDIVTGELLFEWRASDWIAIEDTHLNPDRSYQGRDPWNGMDWFHMNSVEKDSRGNFLISSRHMRSLYYISGDDGSVIWTMGGDRNDFIDLSDGHATNFAWQHHARWTSDAQTSMTVFDNRDSKFEFAPDYVSRGIILDVDTKAMTVSLRAEYRAPSNITCVREGSMQLLGDSNENVLVGWGNEPAWTEYSKDGTIVWDVRFGPLSLDRDSPDNYRALKVNWTGTPTWSPKIAAGPENVSLVLPVLQTFANATLNNTAYFSWNGATDVRKWIILASDDETSPLNSTDDMWQEIVKTGFETSVYIGAEARFVRALAVAANDTILGATPVLDMQFGNTTETAFNATVLNMELATITRAWGKSTLDMLKQKWEQTRASKHFAPAAGGLSGLVVIGAIGALALCCVRRRRGATRAYKPLSGRKRSDTLDSKLDVTFQMNVVDHDEELYSSGEDSGFIARYSSDEDAKRM